MKVLNLGSSGQIGAYLTEYLRKKGHEVIEYDKNLGAQYNLTAIPSTWLESCIKEADFVFFLAFDVGGSRYLKKYQHSLSTGVLCPTSLVQISFDVWRAIFFNRTSSQGKTRV